MKPFFGYPGGKSKAVKIIDAKIQLDAAPIYVEPFAGAFSIGLYYAEKYPSTNLWINDIDSDLYCLWKAAIEYTDQLCNAIKYIRVDANLFYTLRDEINKKLPYENKDLIQRAVNKLVIHKISFSNLGEKSGSPVGGKNQSGNWKFDTRWKPELICNRIRKISKLLSNSRITNLSFEDILDKIPDNALVYIDPPYVEGGPKCYKFFFTESQHKLLSQKLKKAKFKWFLTYDNHSLITSLYNHPNVKIDTLNLLYSMSSCSQQNNTVKKVKELLISNF